MPTENQQFLAHYLRQTTEIQPGRRGKGSIKRGEEMMPRVLVDLVKYSSAMDCFRRIQRYFE